MINKSVLLHTILSGACPCGGGGVPRGLPPPPLEIEKQKKIKNLSYFTYILLLYQWEGAVWYSSFWAKQQGNKINYF